MDFKKTIKGILLMKGREILEDEKKFLSIFRDMQPQMESERKFLENLYSCDGISLLLYSQNLSNEKKTEVFQYLKKELSVRFQWKDDRLLRVFLEAIDWKIPVSSASKKKEQTPASQEKKEEPLKKRSAGNSAPPLGREPEIKQERQEKSIPQQTSEGIYWRNLFRKITNLIVIYAAASSIFDEWQKFIKTGGSFSENGGDLKVVLIMGIVMFAIAFWGLRYNPRKHQSAFKSVFAIVRTIFFGAMAFVGVMMILMCFMDRKFGDDFLVGILFMFWGIGMSE